MDRRKPLRFPGQDYHGTGHYFLTFTIQDRLRLFGQIEGGQMICNPAGDMITHWWNCLPSRFPGWINDSFVVMPDHFHALVYLKPKHEPFSLGEAVAWFKTMSTNAYIRGAKEEAWLRFRGKLWHRNYFEKKIRRISWIRGVRNYILNNPVKWRG